MSVMPYATVVGVFRDRTAANLAMEALLNAGFKREQMRYLVADNAGGFLDSLRSVFTGTSPVEESLVTNLTEMGLSSEEARYFSDEYEQGSAILAIKTQGDDEMAQNILYQYGAYNTRERSRFGSVSPNPITPAFAAPTSEYVAPVYPQAVSNTDTPAAETVYAEEESVEPFQPEPYTPTTPFPQEVADDINTPLPEEAASDPSAPFPSEVAHDPDSPFPTREDNNFEDTPLSETANPDMPFPEEVASDPNTPLPEENQAAIDGEYQAPETLEIDSVEEVVTPVYQDEQATLLTPEVMEVDVVSASPVNQSTYAPTQTELPDLSSPLSETTDTNEQGVYPLTTSTEEDTTDGEQVDTFTPSADETDVEDNAYTTPETLETTGEEEADAEESDVAPFESRQAVLDEATAEPLLADSTAFDEQNLNTPATASETFAQPNEAYQTTPNAGYSAYDHAAELQKVLSQVETTKQQLAEARAQLEQAKEHESRLNTARLQLQELQAELQAVQAELHQTRQRYIG